MTLEENKTLARKSLKIWSTGNFAEMEQIYQPSFVNHQPHLGMRHEIKGLEAWKNFIQEFRVAFPDFMDTIEDQIAEGNKVVVRFTSKGTHTGRYLGFEPTHKKISITGIAVYRIESGKIAEEWVNWDLYGLLEQLGMIATPTHH